MFSRYYKRFKKYAQILENKNDNLICWEKKYADNEIRLDMNTYISPKIPQI